MNSYNSHIFGGSEEECHSSESGWTMYIGSPVVDDDDDVDEAKNDVEDQYKGGGGGGGGGSGGVESDDSMLSDASSAMTSNVKKKDMYKRDDAEQKKNSRKWMKIGADKAGTPEKKKDKESASRNAAPSQSDNKVRRNWLGKKK